MPPVRWMEAKSALRPVMYLSGASFPLLILVGSLYLPPNCLILIDAGDASPYTELRLCFLHTAWAGAKPKGQSKFISRLEAGFADPET